MNTESHSGTSGQQLLKQIMERIEELAQATDSARMSEEMTRYLDTFARFHRYSMHNSWLIMMACPGASVVAGFHAWQKLKRYVRKGEHGIPILAPILINTQAQDDAEEMVLRGFKVVYVFDISQTDGEPLPDPPDWKSPERNALLSERLMTFAQERGITVTEQALRGEAQGVSKGGRIELAPTAGTSTLIHEIAHELMHKGVDAPPERVVRELEAECVSFVVAHHFGLQCIGSPNYVALHGASSKLILEHMERISQTSAQIIEAVEGQG